jgi:DMSO/TMAO reductase YedYZ molybdopterin-dependent catalytic subunit
MNNVRLNRPRAALIGIMSTLLAVAAGHLVAGVIDPGASPYLAVGNTAIDLTPSAVKDFAVRTFGIYDKLVLLLGMVPVIALFALAAGLVSRRRPLPGMVLIGALGAVGILAVLRRPEVGQLALLAPAAALLAGVLVFRWLHGLAVTDNMDGTNRRTRAAEPTDTPVRNGGHAGAGGLSTAPRRGFLVATAATAAAAGAAGLAGQLLNKRVDVQASRRAVGTIRPAVPAPRIPNGADFAADGTPTFLTPNPTFYRVDTALVVPRLRAEEWSLRVHGMVDRELTLRYDDLRNRELVEKTITLTCVSNEIGGPYVSTANFVGVPLREVLNEAGVRAGADQLASRSVDGWTCGTPTDVVMDPDRALLALAMNGEPLPTEHGFPVRMVVPGLYGYVSATKWLVDLELTTFDAFDAYWARRGWAKKAPIKTMSRIDRPAGFQRVPAGTVVVAGVAWAQHRGIEAVEVRADGGPWTEATLAAEVNLDTWRMWRAELDLTPGGHTVEARATDKTGYTQTAERAEPIPDGASGWHSVYFSVT